MRKCRYLIIGVLTYYLAAMFRFWPLLLLAMAELFAFLAMFFLSRYLQRHLRIGYEKSTLTAYQGQPVTGRILVEHTGAIPASYLRVVMKAGYRDEQKQGKIAVTGSVWEHEKKCMEFQEIPVHCGILELSAKRMAVYDYLRLFKATKRLDDRAQIFVLPTAVPMQIAFQNSSIPDPRDQQEQPDKNQRGEDGSEILQFREYQEGDLSRAIHWKLSARMQQLWVKEYEREDRMQVTVSLDMRGWEELSLFERDAYYETLLSLLLGLLEASVRVLAVFKNTENGMWQEHPIHTKDQCEELLLFLYRMDRSKAGESTEMFFEEDQGLGLSLDLRLRLFCKTRLIREFSKENYRNEIQYEQIII